MTATEVYAHLGQAILDITPYPGWAKILLRVERDEGAQGYNGMVMADSGTYCQGLLANSIVDKQVFEPIETLYRITTQGGNNQWNLLYFTLMPGGAFEVDFLWDKDRAAMLEAAAQTRNTPEPEREQVLLRLDAEIAASKSERLYQQISQRLAKIHQSNWQQVTLGVKRANAATFTLSGEALTSDNDEPEEVSVGHDWEFIKLFYELSIFHLHPRWNLAQWTVRPDGTYSIVFDWDATFNPRRPRNTTFPYTREGHWQEYTS